MKPPYTVIWLHELIERQIASFVVQASEQGRPVRDITSAMDSIDGVLSRRPHVAGESREGRVRVLVHMPLIVDYEVHEEQSAVVVIRARYSPRIPPAGDNAVGL